MDFEPYIDIRGRWRWRITNDKGRIIGRSNASFHSETACITDAHILASALTHWVLKLNEELTA